MEVPLVTGVGDDPGFLQQVVLEGGPQDAAMVREDELQVLAKPGAVVVHDGLGVPEGLENGVYL